VAESKNWYLVCYDIRCPKRWRKAYKLLEGYGERIQFSIFRCWLSQRDREKLRCNEGGCSVVGRAMQSLFDTPRSKDTGILPNL
jgi:CRISPR associated protein Cas2